MKKVRIKNFDHHREYNGMIGTVTEDNYHIWRVVMDNGVELLPYAPDRKDAQCELVEEQLPIFN